MWAGYMGTARTGTDRPAKEKDKCILMSYGKRADGDGPTYRVCIICIYLYVFVSIRIFLSKKLLHCWCTQGAAHTEIFWILWLKIASNFGDSAKDLVEAETSAFQIDVLLLGRGASPPCPMPSVPRPSGRPP
jgi:hypothetical protein